MNYKYTIIYSVICLLLFGFIIKWGTSVINMNCFKKSLKEGLTDFEKYSYMVVPYPKDAVIDYNDINSPLYSHTVNLPLTDRVSCKNFCGPKAQCAITREQCTADIDCYGCNPGPKPLNSCATKEVRPYDNGGKLTQNQGLNYSPLTTGYNNHGMDFEEVYPGSKEAQIIQPYLGVDKWTRGFNEGLKLYNKKQELYDKYQEERYNIGDTSSGKIQDYAPNYPTTISATGAFFETTPPSSNAYLV